MRKPTCEDCQYGRIYRDPGDYYNPPTEDFSCEKDSNRHVLDFMDRHGEDFIYNADNCSMFLPWMVDNCSWDGCNKRMDIPVYQAKYSRSDKWSGEPIYYCSQDCKGAAEVTEALLEAE